MIRFSFHQIKCSVLAWPLYPSIRDMIDANGMKLYAGWIIYTVVTYFVIPGKMVIGQPLACGKRLVYTSNGNYIALYSHRCLYNVRAHIESCNFVLFTGFRVFVLTLALFTLCTCCGLDVNSLYDRLYSLMTSALLTAVTLSMYLHWRASGLAQEEKSQCGNTGKVTHTVNDPYTFTHTHTVNIQYNICLNNIQD